MVLEAWRNLKRIERDAASRAELPIAQALCLYINSNRDPNKAPKPFTIHDFTLFSEKSPLTKPFSPQTAAAALRLKAEGRIPRLLLAAWPDILESLQDTVPAPKITALHNDEETVWVLAPRLEGRDIRGGLVLVHGDYSGPIRLRDMDRPLNTYTVFVPKREGYGWLEGELLLLAAEN